MVDVAHDGHDRRPRLQRRGIVGGVEQAFLDVGLGDAPHRVAELLGEQLRGVGVDRVGDLRHLALLHQELDHVDAALRHAVGEFLDGDGLRNGDFAHELFLLLAVAMAGHALRAAAERRDRTLAHLVGAERGDEGQAAALLRRAGARRLGRRGGTRRGAAGAAAGRAAIVVVGFGRERARDRRRGRRSWPCGLFLAAEALLGDLVGLALGLFVVAAAIFLGALARLGGLALGAFDRVALGADLRLFLGDLALLGLAHLGVAERVGARGRALPRSACAARRRTASAAARRGACGGATRRCRRAPTTPPRRGVAPRSGAGAGAASAGLASPGPPMRRFTFSTTTALERPWLKLWRTTPVSARGLSVSVLVEVDAQRLLAGALRISSHSHPILNAFENIVNQPRAIPCRVRPDRWSGSVRGSGSARGTRCSLGRRAGQHVPHLTAPMPNPIAPT